MSTNQAVIRNRLGERDTFATTLLTIAIDTYFDPQKGAAAILGPNRWSLETIIMELEDDYNVRIPQLCQDKLFVAINLVTSNDFFKRTRRFIDTCNVLAGSELSRAFDPADAMECAWGMTEALLLLPPEDQDADYEFCEEIRHYLGKVLDEEGIREPPDLLRLAIRPTTTGQADYGDMPVDDPASFSMMYEVQADRSLEIKEMLERELLELFNELASLPVKNGNTADLLKRIQGKLTR